MQARTIFILALIVDCTALVISISQQGLFSWLNAALLLASVLTLFSYLQTESVFRELLKLAGLNNTADFSKSLSAFLKKTKQRTDEINHAISAIDNIGQEKYSKAIDNISDEETRKSLYAANEKIFMLRQKERETAWITEGVASIAELKHRDNDIAEYSYNALCRTVKYINANQGGFFLLKTEGNDRWFELIASYAYGKKKFLSQRINLGEGLLGQAYYDKEITCITEVPQNYIKITSGIGEALPRFVCIVPLISEGTVYGAMELASFEKLLPYQLEYLGKIGDSIGYNLGAIENNKRTEMLLLESQKMAQEVKSQEEELRQNMEELQATQEQMTRKERELDAVMSSLSTVEVDLDGKVLEANPVFLSITGYKREDISGKLYKSLIPQEGNDPIQYEMMWKSILSGKSFSGEFRIINKDRKQVWMAGNFTPILNDEGQPYKIMVISLFTTQDKEKLLELQEMITALKMCFPMAEVNADMTFKSANDLFLTALGIRRLELKKTLPQNVLANGSFGKLEQMLKSEQAEPSNVILNINNKEGQVREFNTTLIRIQSARGSGKKGLLILRNER